MKHLIPLFAAFVLLCSTQLSAQDRTAVSTTTQDQGRYQDDIRSTSAMLKETRSVVDTRMRAIEKQLATADAEGRSKLGSDRDDLIEAQSMIDQTLTLVNTATAENWEKVRTKAMTVNTMVRETLASMK